MTIGRNDTCRCGSGRKYKKCCLMKESLAQANQQFFQLKYELTTKMLAFLQGHVTRQELREATKLFQQIQQHETMPKVADSNNKFWLCYFYPFFNGLRGVEWFLEKEKHLSAAGRALLSRWVQMRPRLLQMTGEEASGITLTDLITKEDFFLPYCESLQKGLSSGVTIAMLEPFGDGYCVHGISSFKDPKMADELIRIVRERMQKTEKDYPDVMLESYLELVEYTLSPIAMEKDVVLSTAEESNKMESNQEDLPYFEQVGITPETSLHFYAEDLAQFFKEKTLGKSASTVKKYQWGIQKVVNYFHYLKEQPLTWNDCVRSFWEDLIARFYLLDSEGGTLSQAQSFVSVTKNLAQWLDKKHQTTLYHHVKDILHEREEDLLNSVRSKPKELVIK